jgi:HTH-type transcriptional regulator, sugar sensing transcriptional regulator
MEGLLVGLGLTQYEARALATLLRTGERSGPELARQADVPFGRIYDTVNGLVERGLVQVRDGRPKRFAAVAGAAIPQRLLAAERRRMQEEQTSIESRAQSLTAELAGLEPAAAPGAGSASVRIGEAPARDHLVEATHAAKGEVVAFLALGEVVEADLALFDAFRQAVNRDVTTRILLRQADVAVLAESAFAGELVDAVLPHLGRNLQVRLTDADAPPFSVLDRQRTVIGVRDPGRPTRYFAVVTLEDPVFATRLMESFEAMWQTAGTERSMMQNVLRRLGDTESNRWVRRRLEAALKRKVAKS